jgi:hypothetical protein
MTMRWGYCSSVVPAFLALAFASAHAQTWTGTNVNGATPAGSATASGTTYTVNGGGGDVSGTSDRFFFYHQATSLADVRITARLASLTNTNAGAKAGLMIRETTAAGSRHVSMLVNPPAPATNQTRFRRRRGLGSASYDTGVVTGSAPVWLRVVRRGGSFYGFRSADGVTWTLSGIETLASPAATMEIGLAVASVNATTACQAVFENVTIDAPPPGGTGTPVPIGTGLGILGEYYDNGAGGTANPGAPTGFPAGPAYTRTDASVNFFFENGGPGGPLLTEDFMIRWVGSIEPRFTETYQFYTESDDGVRVLVNGVQVINNWTGHTAVIDAGTPVPLTAGYRYPLEVHYFENNGSGARLRLFWESASQPAEVVPPSQLFTFPSPVGGSPGPNAGGGGGGGGGGGNVGGAVQSNRENDNGDGFCFGRVAAGGAPAAAWLLAAAALGLAARRRT